MHTPFPTLNKAGKGMLSKLMNDTVDAKKTPAIFIGATTAGETLVLDCAGDLVCRKAGSGKVDLGTTLQLYSATKLVTTVACLQLVDRGLLSLDVLADVNKHLPKLGELQNIKGYMNEGEAILEDQVTKSKGVVSRWG
ncbi:hypothetical protein NliqN6_2739 [Naganishia liquefaciens]|uniref:Beta-lactamase-related domain-containing protein n=1 Tax=Naganishia liquefaciens TaxID=104408 RepID=A0A8H3YFL7_9TREE|nr:hypothetical protein NliqN6_2739 [Naganishia liquefaciens]